MPNHQVGFNYSFTDLVRAFDADPQGDTDAHYLLYRGDEILALCLRYKYNPDPTKVKVGNDQIVAEWGKKLAALKGKKTLPLYYSQRGRKLYEYRGHQLITGDTEDQQVLEESQGPVPLSRIVSLKPVPTDAFSPAH